MARKRIVSTAQEREAVIRYQAGESARAIGASFGCGRSPVESLLRRHGVTLRQGTVLSATQQQEAIARYQAGESARSIGRSFGHTARPVENLLKARGIWRERKFRGFTPSQEADVAARYKARESASSIARSYGCGRETVVRLLMARSAYQPRRFQVFTPAEREEMAQRFRAGEKPAQIARHLNCSQTTVDRWLKDHKVWLPPTHQERVGSQWTMGQKREMVHRYESGDSIYKIAREFVGLPTTVWTVLRAFGVEFRDNAWRGGRVAASSGYVAVRVDPSDPIGGPMAWVTGYVPEHRLVMGRKLGRPLQRHETVHHINGDKLDNSPGNLQLRNGKHGKGVRLECLDCGSANVGPVTI